MRTFEGLAGFKLKPRKGAHDHFVLRDAEGVTEIERMLERPGADWTARFEERLDRVSLAVFGVTGADTRPQEPHPDQIKDDGPLSRWLFSKDARQQYDQMLNAWYDWQATIGGVESEIKAVGAERYWARRQIDITDGEGDVLRCYAKFERQLAAAHMNLLPGARITADGTGRRGPQSVDDWASALEAAAARFKPSR